MTTRGGKSFKQARAQRRDKNDARRIRSERDKARSSTSGAARRWPFELLQNAHDPGPRDDSLLIDVYFTATESTLRFLHDGNPFTWDDLAALTSGGSNKEYESAETSGRYGTGFLVTHVLSPIINVSGIVGDEESNEQFYLNLDRSGDETAILKNMERAEADIDSAQTIAKFDDDWTADFSYPIDNRVAMETGIKSVEQSALFLFGTCYNLGRLVIETNGLVASWQPEDMKWDEYGEIVIRERTVIFEGNGESNHYRIMRLIPPDHADVGLLILLRLNRGEWEFVAPPVDLPRVFSRFPVRRSAFLPINCVIDGQFSDVEERDRIAMNDSDKVKLEAALQLIPKALSLGVAEDWEQSHRLAKLAKVQSGFSEDGDPDELSWWNKQLCRAARDAARLPLIETRRGFLQGLYDENGDYAHFILPRYSRTTTFDQVPQAKSWKVASDTWLLDPPTETQSAEANELSAGWEELGVSVRRLGLKELANEVRDGVTRVEELPTAEGEQRRWLAQYFDLIGELPSDYDCSDLVDGLVPNQRGALCSSAALKRDTGISEYLKGIAELMDCGVREKLLDQELEKLGDSMSLPLCNSVLRRAIPAELTEQNVIEDCLTHLSHAMPDGRQAEDDESTLVEAAILLLAHLWATKGSDGAQLAQRCPLLTREGIIVHHTAKKIMAPVAAWPKEACPFADIYPPARVLADVYCERSPGGINIVEALVEWDIAFRAPLFRRKSNEVGDQVLAALSDGKDDLAGMTVKDETFSQVALFNTDVIQRCQESIELATLLFGFVLKYLAPADHSWREFRPVIGKCKGKDVPIRIRDSLWLAELKRRSWVPMRAEGGKTQVGASQASLTTLLRDKWLVGNDAGVKFLVECFGFEALQLRLQAFPSEKKKQISSWLAELVHFGGDDPEFYNGLVLAEQNRRHRQQEKERNRKFGLAVQDAIQAYLTGLGMTVKVMDRGYDFDVDFPDDIPLIEAGTHEFAVGPYLVEVKATTSDSVRLTPAQARVASSSDNFILCVVDLRKCARDRLEQPWAAKDVEPLALMVFDFRDLIAETHNLVDAATERPIAIQNEAQLRYAVPSEIWEDGIPILEWVKRIASTLKTG